MEKVKRIGCYDSDGIFWCYPCNFSNNPPTGDSKYGFRIHPIYGNSRPHRGVDLAASLDKPIYAVRSGTILEAGYGSSAGNYIIIDHGDGLRSVYMHMGHNYASNADERDNYKWHEGIKAGAEVKQGQVIGDVGSTGDSTGPHLHFEIRKDGEWDVSFLDRIDPMIYIGGAQIELEFDLEIGAPTINQRGIDESLRVVNTPYPSYSNWTPSNLHLGKNEGSPRMFLGRRHVLLNNSKHVLFDSEAKNSFICDGYTSIGINTDLMGLPSIDKTEVLNAYKNADGSYKSGELSGDDEKTVASYIYNKLAEAGWHHYAIIGVLANIKAESGLNPARWEDDTDWSSHPGKKKGFGLIQWTPWDKFYNDLPEGYTDPYDIDAQIQGMLDYQNSSYIIIDLAEYGYDTDIAEYINDDTDSMTYLYSTESYDTTKFREYLKDQHGSDFNISYSQYKNGNVNSNITGLSNMDKIYILTIAYTCNAERPGECNFKTRLTYAKHFIDIFGANPGNVVSKSPVEENSFWGFEASERGYSSESEIPKDNYSYCISRANDIIKTVCGETAKKFIIHKNNITENWFEYNLNNLKFDYGNIPKIGSIICWKNLKDDTHKLGILEEVLSTNCIIISDYDLSRDPETDVSKKDPKKCYAESKIVNNNHNWSQIIGEYEFQGFIYLVPDISLELITVDSEQETPVGTYIRKEVNGDLTISVENKSVSKDKYKTLMFSINNMKHINNLNLTYRCFKDNTQTGNEIQLCLAQQVWNCSDLYLPDLASDASDAEKDAYKYFFDNWPYTYFPYKEKVDNIPESDPNYYHGPFPTGNLTLEKIAVDNDSVQETEDRRLSIDLYNYVDSAGSIIDSFDNNGDMNRLIRNHPGYLCVIVKAPKVSKDQNDDSVQTRTTLVLKQILAQG